MPPKKKEYVKFGTTKIRIPPKMVGIDNNNKAHLYKTITPARRLSYHNKKPALDITINRNTKTKINRVPRTTQRISFIETKKPRKPRQPRQPRLPSVAALAPPPPPPAPFQPPFQPPPRPPPPQPPRPENPPYQPPPRPPPLPPQLPLLITSSEQHSSSTLNRVLRGRLARKQVQKLKSNIKVENAIKRLNVSTSLASKDRKETDIPITGYVDTYEQARLRQIEKINEKQKNYKEGLNRRNQREKAANYIIEAVRYKLKELAANKKPKSNVLMIEAPPISNEQKEKEKASDKILTAIRYKLNELRKAENIKLQQKLLKEATSSLSAPINVEDKQEEEQKLKNLKKKFNEQRDKQDKEQLKNQKERQKEFPKSFKDQIEKDWYIETITKEFNVYKEDTYKLYEKLQEAKTKPINSKNQKKIYDLELETILIGGEAKFWKAEIARATKIKI